LQAKVEIQCQIGVEEPYKVAALEWYNGAYGCYEDNCPTLAVCFDNGHCQFMRSEQDNSM